MRGLRSQDHENAERWGWMWHYWISAVFLRGYLDAAGNVPFVPGPPEQVAELVALATLERALTELRHDLRTQLQHARVSLLTIAWLGLTKEA
jgi:maltose alpha-D-glucosyltransferase/alpha-amylase